MVLMRISSPVVPNPGSELHLFFTIMVAMMVLESVDNILHFIQQISAAKEQRKNETKKLQPL